LTGVAAKDEKFSKAIKPLTKEQIQATPDVFVTLARQHSQEVEALVQAKPELAASPAVPALGKFLDVMNAAAEEDGVDLPFDESLLADNEDFLANLSDYAQTRQALMDKIQQLDSSLEWTGFFGGLKLDAIKRAPAGPPKSPKPSKPSKSRPGRPGSIELEPERSASLDDSGNTTPKPKAPRRASSSGF
jgi:hypothetical protein